MSRQTKRKNRPRNRGRGSIHARARIAEADRCAVSGCPERHIADTEDWATKFCCDHHEAMGSPKDEPADLGPTLAVFGRRMS